MLSFPFRQPDYLSKSYLIDIFQVFHLIIHLVIKWLRNAVKHIDVSHVVDCERGFNTMKRIKTVLRNKMKQDTLGNVLMCSFEGKDEDDFEYDAACDIWATMSNRRLDISILRYLFMFCYPYN